MSRKPKKGRGKPGKGLKKARQEPDRVFTVADNLLFALVLLILFLRAFLSGRTYPHYNHFFHLAVCVATILWLVKCYKRGTLELHNRLLTGFVLAFALVCSITFFTTINKGITLRYIYEIISYTLLFLIIANNFRDGASIKAAVFMILASGLLVNIYGVYQRYVTLQATRDYIENVIGSGNQDMLMGLPLKPEILYRLQSQRIFSTFLFPNAYSLFLAISAALAIGLIWSMRGKISKFAGELLKKPVSQGPALVGYRVPRPVWLLGRILLLALCAISCILIPWNLWMTGSRGGWLSAIAIVFVLLATGLWGRKIPVGGKVAALLFVAVLLTTFTVGGDAFSAEPKAEYEESFAQRLTDSSSVRQRFTYWKASLEMVKDHPWLGVGWGAFEAAYPRFMILGGYPVKLAHNNYLQVWAETGTVGLNAFIGMWLVFLYTFWRKARPGAAGELRGIACGLGAGVIGFLVNSLVDFALYLPPLMYFIYAMMGLLVAIPSERTEGDKFTFRFSSLAGIASIIAVCFFTGLIFKSYQGMRIFMKVEDERNRAFPTKFAIEEGMQVDRDRQYRVLKESVPLLKESIGHYSYDSEAHHMLGDVHVHLFRLENATRQMDEGISHLKRGGDLSPYSPHIFNSLAVAYWMMGNATGDRELFQKALEAELIASENFPVNPDYHGKLRQIYKALGEHKKAREERRKANELKKHYKLH